MVKRNIAFEINIFATMNFTIFFNVLVNQLVLQCLFSLKKYLHICLSIRMDECSRAHLLCDATTC